jgi:hypothetical protein
VLDRVPSIDKRCEFFDWLCSSTMAIDYYGQVDHRLKYSRHLFTDSEALEVWEGTPEFCERVPEAFVNF